MKFSFSIQYSTEGAPMLIGDVENAQHWNGAEYDGGDIIVEYWGEGIETLPKELGLKTKRGSGERRFPNAGEAAKFEKELLKHLLKLHPKASKPANMPDYPVYSVGSNRVFGIERKFTSPYDTMTAKLKGDVADILFQKQNKAHALFLEMEGAGPGLIALDSSMPALVVAKIVTAEDDAAEPIRRALEQTAIAKLKPKGKVTHTEHVAIFNSALAANTIARHNWGTATFHAGATRATASKALKPIQVPNQSVAGGAVLRTKPGSYKYAVTRNKHAGHTTYNALWLWHDR